MQENVSPPILPNKLGLTTFEAVGFSEFEGFLEAEIRLTEALTSRAKFDLKYILAMHRMALGHLYPFAGKYRDVNMSKGGFVFPSAQFLPQSMELLQSEILGNMPHRYNDPESFIVDLAKVHAELLFIHPFREGNGRTARLLANLMMRKQGYAPLRYERIDAEVMKAYIGAVQAAASQEYQPMERLIRFIFPV
ncbi:cell filamentation protein [Dyadobacter jejuensis]|uniref:Cell filamentation protein n=1 Tax=Dyadobacter jejuensis TaxID=1082580 RepID=A0A316ASM1_9BACT|nr:Fic family protein [Dyadobacter jejuensis]PWJ60451.1 cell filamentation protein [Dyadobacter jejuensis]